MSERSIADVLKIHATELMALPGVVGVAQGELNGAPCVTVMVIEKTRELNDQIPKVLDGFPVKVSETGELKAQ